MSAASRGHVTEGDGELPRPRVEASPGRQWTTIFPRMPSATWIVQW
jgi:hypothetical protein